MGSMCTICGEETIADLPGWIQADELGGWICPDCVAAGRPTDGAETWISPPPAADEPDGWEDVP